MGVLNIGSGSQGVHELAPKPEETLHLLEQLGEMEIILKAPTLKIASEKLLEHGQLATVWQKFANSVLKQLKNMPSKGQQKVAKLIQVIENLQQKSFKIEEESEYTEFKEMIANVGEIIGPPKKTLRVKIITGLTEIAAFFVNFFKKIFGKTAQIPPASLGQEHKIVHLIKDELSRKLDVRQLITGSTARLGKISSRFAHILVSSAKQPPPAHLPKTTETKKAQWDTLLKFPKKPLFHIWDRLFKSPQEVSAKLLFHILGDPIGASEEDLAGYMQIDAWNDFIRLMDTATKAFNCTKEFQPYRKSLEVGVKLGRMIEEGNPGTPKKLKQQISALGKGESLIIPAGWSAMAGGHAIVFEFKKGKTDKDNQLIIHNTGGGIQFHARETIEAKKNVARLVMSGVSTDIFCSPVFLQCLHTLHIPNEEHPWSEKELYEVLLPTLKGTAAELLESPEIETQRSGICTWTSLFSYAATKMRKTTFGEYEKIRLAMGLKVLNDFVFDEKHNLPAHLLLAAKCQQYLSQFLIQAMTSGAITQDEFRYIQEKISAIEVEIQHCRQSIDQKKSILTSTPIPRKATELTIHPKKRLLSMLKKEPAIKQTELPLTKEVAMMPSCEIPSIKDCPVRLREMTNWIKEQTNAENYEEAQYAIEIFSTKLVTFLQSSQDSITSLSKEERAPLFGLLHQLGKMYIENRHRIGWQQKINPYLLPRMVTTCIWLIQAGKILGKDMMEIRDFPLCSSGDKGLGAYSLHDVLNGQEFSSERFQEESLAVQTMRRWEEGDPLSFNVATDSVSLNLRRVNWSEEPFSQFLVKLFQGNGIPLDRRRRYVPGEVWDCLESDQLRALALCADRYTEEAPTGGVPLLDFPFSKNLYEFRQLVDCLPILLANFSSCKQDFDFSTELIVRANPSVIGKADIRKKLHGLESYSMSSSNYDDPLVDQGTNCMIPLGLHPSHDSSRVEELGKTPTFQQCTRPSDRVDIPEKLLQLIRTRDPVQIDTALSIFSSYPELLSKSSWRHFLERVVFSSSSFEAGTSNPIMNTTNLIADFLRSEMVRSRLNNDIYRSIFTVRMARMLSERDPKEALPRKEIEEWCTSIQQYIGVAKEDPNYQDYQHLWHYEYARFLSLDPSCPLDTLISSASIAQRTARPNAPYFYHEANVFLREILDRTDVRDHLAKNPSACINSILNNSCTVWTLKEYPIFESPPFTYEAHTGILSRNEVAVVPIPSTLASNKFFRKLTQDHFPQEVVQQKPGLYVFDVDLDSRITTFRVFVEGQGRQITIQKKIGNDWYECLSNSYELSSYDNPRAFPTGIIEGNYIWCHERDPLLRIEHNGKACYEVDFAYEIKIFLCDEREKRTTTQVLSASCLPEYFLSVEKDEYIIPFSSDGKTISRILFPRIGTDGLSFSYDNKNHLFRRDDAPDQVLLPNQYISSLEGVGHKLVVRDIKTKETTVLLFGHELEAKSYQSAVSTECTFEGPSTNIPIYMLRKEKKDVTPLSSEATAYLAYNLLVEQQYEKSFHVLDALEKTPLSQEILQILQWIATSSPHDTDVKADCIRLKAQAALERQQKLFNRQLPAEKGRKGYEGSYSFYEFRHLAGSLYLTEEEQILLGRRVVPQEITIWKEASQIPASSIVMDKKYAENSDYFFEHHSYGRDSLPSPLDPHLKTFWGFASDLANLEKQKINWSYYWKILQSHAEVSLGINSCSNMDELMLALEIAARSEPSYDSTAAAILLAICKNPEPFFKLPRWHKRQREKTWGTWFTIAQEILTFPAVEEQKKAEEPKIEPKPQPVFHPAEKRGEAFYTKLPSASVDPAITGFQDLPPYSRLLVASQQKTNTLANAQHVIELLPEKSTLSQTASNEFLDAVSHYEEQSTTVTLSLQTKELSEVKAALTTQRDGAKTQAKMLRHKLVSLLYKRREDLLDMTSLQNSMEAAGFTQPSLIQDALFALLRPFPDGFLDLNPALSLEDAASMRAIAIEYLENKTFFTHIDSILAALGPMEEGAASQENLQSLYALLQTKREYVAADEPHYLVFEEAFGHILRKDQIQSLATFMSGKYSAEVMELIMGSGKTSVLFPILAYIMAKNGKLPIMVLPDNLYPSMAPEIARIFLRSFSKHMFSWDTPLNESISLEKLRLIEQGIKRTYREGGAIICKPIDICGLFLDFLATLDLPQSKETDAKTELYQSIFTEFKKHGRSLFDEVDSIWDVLKQNLLTNSPLKPIDPQVLDVSTMLYELLESIPLEEKTKAAFTTKVIPQLIKKAVKRLCAWPDSKIQEEVKKNIHLITEYLSGTRSEKDIESLIHCRGVLAVCYQQIHQVLPETYPRILGVHYGEAAEPNKPYAVPYEGGLPTPRRFSNDLEEVSCSLQLFMQCSQEKLHDRVQEWVQRNKLLLTNEMLLNPKITIMASPKFIFLANILGEEMAKELCFGPTSAITNKILESFRKEPVKKIRFIQEVYLRELQRPSTYQRVSSQLYSLLFEIFGFSGMVWNKDTYATGVHASVSIESVGKTASILLGDAQQPVKVFSDLKEVADPNHGIIDVGGKLVDYSGQEIAQSILDRSDPNIIKGVIFYDKEKKPCVLERGKTPYPLSQCTLPKTALTAYWAKPFTTGSDLQICPTAECEVVISKDTILRDVFQGVWRPRGLGRGQKVHFAVDRETESIIRTTLHIKDIPLTNEHILAFSLHNQIAIQGPNNYRAFKDKAESLLQKPLIGMFLSPDARTAYKRCKEVFFSEKPRDLFQLYGAQVQRLPTDTALTNTCDRIEHSSSVAYLKEKGALPTLHEDLESLQSMKAVLPTHVQDIPEEIGAGVQIQVATQTQTSTQTLTQVQFISNPQEIKRDKFLDFGEYLESLASAKDFSAATPPYTQKTIKENPVTSIQNVFEPEKETAKYASLFPNNFFASLNLFPCDVEEFTPLTTYCQPFSYMLYVRDTKTKAIHSILLNQQDAVALLETSFPQKKSRYEIVLANIHSGEMFAHGSSKRLKTHLAKDMDFLIRRVQAKMLSGNMNLSFQEQAAFIAWCSSLGEEGFSQVWDLCLKYIGVTHPEASETMWVLYPIIQDQGISVTTNLLKQLIATLPQDPQREILEQHLAFLEKNKKVTVEIMQDILNLAQKS